MSFIMDEKLILSLHTQSSLLPHTASLPSDDNNDDDDDDDDVRVVESSTNKPVSNTKTYMIIEQIHTCFMECRGEK